MTVSTSGVTEYFNAGGTNLVEASSNAPAANAATGDVTITWSSVEGGTYKVEASSDLSTWTTIAASVVAPANVITQTSVVESATGLPATNAKRFYNVALNP